MPTLEKRFRQGFPGFYGGHFFKSIFWGKKFMKSSTLFFGSIFWGKKFMTNCSAYIAKNPRGPVGEGVQGEYRGGVPRTTCRVLWRFPPMRTSYRPPYGYRHRVSACPAP